ncbi:MAG TPA: MFS transporter [Polyangiaceae bacterium]
MVSSRRVARLLFAVAWGTNHFVPLLLVYRARLALSAVELAVLFGVYAVGLVPGLLLGGPLSDRRGRRAIVLPASVVALAGTCILAAGEMGFGVLLAGRFVVGLGAGATFSAGTAWVQDLAGDEVAGTGPRRAAVALSGGFGGGPLLTGVLAQWLPWPMQLPYAAHALVLVASIMAVALSARGDGRARDRRATAPPSAPGSAGQAGSDRAAPNARRFPAGFAAVAIVAPWVFALPSVSSAVLPGLVRAKLGSFGVVFAGLVTGSTLLSGVLVQPVMRTWRSPTANTFGLSMGAIGLLCGIVAAKTLSPLAVLVAALLLGAGYGGCLIAGLRFIETRGTPETRGRLTGIFYALTYVGFAWPLVVAAIARRVGDVPSLVVTWSLCLATLAWSVWRGRAGERD